MPSDLLLGPVAALAGALVLVGVLWRAHLKSDTDALVVATKEIEYRERLRQEVLADQRERERRLEARLARLTEVLKEATKVAAQSTRLSERVVKNGK